MFILGLILAVLIVCGLVVAFAAFVMFWVVMIVFGMSSIAPTLLFGDRYLGFFLAFPVTGLMLWAFGRLSEKPSATQDE